MICRNVLVVVAAIIAAACGRGVATGPSTSSTPVFQFTASPIVISKGQSLNQRGYGTSRIRPELEFWEGGPVVNSSEVLAPADGSVLSVATVTVSGISSQRIDFEGAGGMRFYLTGLETTVVGAGQAVASGQRVGTLRTEFRQGAKAIGLGLMDPSRIVQFARPERYSDEVLRGLSPLDYYAPALRASLGSLLYVPTDGSLECDVVGTLQGLWFEDGRPIAGSTDTSESGTWLWFVPSEATAGAMRVRFSQEASPQTFLTADIPSGAPAPRTVTTATGRVTYRFNDLPSYGSRVLLVEMLSPSRVRAEAFDGAVTPNPTQFTEAARVFVR